MTKTSCRPAFEQPPRDRARLRAGDLRRGGETPACRTLAFGPAAGVEAADRQVDDGDEIELAEGRPTASNRDSPRRPQAWRPNGRSCLVPDVTVTVAAVESAMYSA